VALFQNLFVAALFTLAAPFLARVPDTGALIHIAEGAALATMALMLLSWGYARAEAQVLLPIEYTAFVWSALFGWIWFREPLGLATVAGTALIVLGSWWGTRGRPQPPDSVPCAP
jgi:S-adenosylmethionine uptake transporter